MRKKGVGLAIAEKRKEHMKRFDPSMTQAKFARMLTERGYRATRSTVANWETDPNTVPPTEAIDLAVELFNISLADLDLTPQQLVEIQQARRTITSEPGKRQAIMTQGLAVKTWKSSAMRGLTIEPPVVLGEDRTFIQIREDDDSLAAFGIYPGEILVFDKQPVPAYGMVSLLARRTDPDEQAIREIGRGPDGVTLVSPLGPADNLPYSEWKVLGKLIAYVPRLKPLDCRIKEDGLRFDDLRI